MYVQRSPGQQLQKDVLVGSIELGQASWRETVVSLLSKKDTTMLTGLYSFNETRVLTPSNQTRACGLSKSLASELDDG